MGVSKPRWPITTTAVRTWERQAYIKARPVAGDLSLGTEFLETLTPWSLSRGTR